MFGNQTVQWIFWVALVIGVVISICVSRSRSTPVNITELSSTTEPSFTEEPTTKKPTENDDPEVVEIFPNIVLEWSIDVIGETDPNHLYRLGGEYQILDYNLNIKAFENSTRTRYTGVLKLEIQIIKNTYSIALLINKDINIGKSEFTVKKSVHWERMKLHVLDSKLFPHDNIVFLVHQIGAGIFYADTTYKVHVHFVATFKEEKTSFYVSNYTGERDEKGMYVITAFGNTNRNPLVSLYGRNKHDPMEARITMQQFDQKMGILASPADKLNHIKDFSNKDKIPPSMYSFFISNFVRTENARVYRVYVHDKSRLPNYEDAEDTQNVFLALDFGSSVIENLRNYLRNEDTRVNCVILPNPEPNVVDVWGMIYYQGTQKIDGNDLGDLLMLHTSVARGESDFTTRGRFAKFRPSSKAIFETVLLVAKANIEQCMGYEWLLAMVEGRHDKFWTQFRVIDFLKYERIGNLINSNNVVNCNVSMDMMYVDHVQPFLWRNSFGLGNFSRSYTEDMYYKNIRFMSLMRWYYDVLYSRNDTLLRVDTLDSFLGIFFNQASIVEEKAIINKITLAVNIMFNTNVFDLNQWMASYEEYPTVIVYVQKQTVYMFQKFRNGTYTNWKIPIKLEYFEADIHSNTVYNTSTNRLLDVGSSNFNATYENVYWILANPSMSVPYRVKYVDDGWIVLARRLRRFEFHHIHHINRAQLIDDSMSLFYQESYPLVHPSVPFNIARYLVKETDFVPWNAASRHFKYLDQKTSQLPISATYRRFVAHLVKPHYERLTIKDRGAMETFSDKKVRNIAIDLACMFGNKQCENDVKELVKQMKEPYRDLNANTRDAVCCAALRLGQKEFMKVVLSHISTNWENLEWDKIQIDLSQTSDPDELNYFLRCITCITEPNFLTNYAKIFFEGNNTLQLQEYFWENTKFSAYPLIFAYSQLQKENYPMEENSLIRWLVIAAHNVVNGFEKRTIGQMLNEYSSKAPQFGRLTRIQQPKLLKKELRKQLTSIAGTSLSFLRHFDSEWEDSINGFMSKMSKP